MSRYHGPQEHRPAYARGRNKGAKAFRAWIRREEAVDRNSRTAQKKRSRKRAAS
jgi:hypothetical protein